MVVAEAAAIGKVESSSVQIGADCTVREPESEFILQGALDLASEIEVKKLTEGQVISKRVSEYERTHLRRWAVTAADLKTS